MRSLGHAARYAIDTASHTFASSRATNDDKLATSRILPRQQQQTQVPTVPVQTIPGGYNVSGPDPGTVAGITLGAVGGFLIILWIIYTCINLGNPAIAETTSSYGGTASVVTRKSRNHSRTHRHSSRQHSHRRGSRVEVRTTSTVRPARGIPVMVDEMSDLDPRGRPHVERVVVEESTTRRISGSRPPPGGPAYGVAVPGPRIVHSDDDSSSEDEVVVVEERSRSPPPPRRHHSRRGSSAYEERRYSESRRR